MIQLNLTVIAQVINFLIALFIITWFAYKPLMRAIEGRQKQIQDAINAAEKEREELVALKEEYQSQLNAARKEAQEIMERASKLADDAKAEIIAKAKDEANRIIKQAEEEIAMEKERVIGEIRDQVASLSVLVAGKIIEKSIDVETHAKLIDDYIKEVGDLVC